MWRHFLRKVSGDSAKCVKCNAIIKTSGGSTSGLHKHLRNLHNIVPLKRVHVENEEQPLPKAKQNSTAIPSVSGFFKKVPREQETLPMIVSRMVTLDGLPIRLLSISIDIRKGLQARGFLDLTSFPNTYRSMILGYHNKTVKMLKTEFEKMKVMYSLFILLYERLKMNVYFYFNRPKVLASV